MSNTPRFDAAYAECLDDIGKITRLEPLYNLARRLELDNSNLSKRSANLAAHLLMVRDQCLVMRERIPISDIGLSDALWSIAREARDIVYEGTEAEMIL